MSENVPTSVSCRRSWRAPLSVFCVRDGDPLGRRLRHGGYVAGAGRDGVPFESPSRAALQYSPTRRGSAGTSRREAGARHGNTGKKSEALGITRVFVRKFYS